MRAMARLTLLAALGLAAGCGTLDHIFKPATARQKLESRGSWGRELFDGDDRRPDPPLRDAPSPAAARRPAPAPRPSLTLSPPRKIRIAGRVPPPSRPDVPPPVGPGRAVKLSAFQRFQQALYSRVLPVLTRLGWGARRSKPGAPPQRPRRVTIHHTVGPRTFSEHETARQIKEIQGYHMHGRSRQGRRDFQDIGYHFLIDGAGRVSEGRPVEVRGEHSGRRADRDNVAVALLGNFERQTPTREQVESLKRLALYLSLRYGIDVGVRGALEGHRYYGRTACPGRHILALLPRLRAEVAKQARALRGRMNKGG